MNAKRLAVMAFLLASTATQAAVFYSKDGYLRLSDSPLFGDTGEPFDVADLGTTFFLEDFEDGTLDPAISLTVLPVDAWFAICTSTDDVCGTADSVDADDGTIDGYGSAGHTLHTTGAYRGDVTFVFDSVHVGFAPTHVGLAWTDGPHVATLQAFDSAGDSIGFVSTSLPPGTNPGENGGTSDDWFLGVYHDTGISAIRVTAANGSPGAAGGLEVDHLQWGYLPNIVPLPPALWLLGAGFLGYLGLGLRGHAAP